MKNTIYLNGRFLTRPLTGVQRTAFELTVALDNLIDEGTTSTDYTFILIYSGEILNPIILKHIKLKRQGLFKDNIWEQFELPIYTAGKLLISMCTISSIFKFKQIVIVHDASFSVNPQYFSFLFKTWYNFAIPLLGKISRHIITVSNFSKQQLIEYCGIKENKLTVIYNAADHLLRFEAPNQLFKSKIDSLVPFCLAVSSQGANKNFKNLSLSIDKINFSKYNMLIAGGIVSALKHSATQSDKINYLGYVSNEELRYLYEKASLFVFPSFYEGFGIPPLEAMISGCPVISSNTSSLPEVLGDAVKYFSPYNVDEIAETLNNTLQNESLLQDLKQKGYLQAAKYSWKQSAHQLFNLIKRYAN